MMTTRSHNKRARLSKDEDATDMSAVAPEPPAQIKGAHEDEDDTAYDMSAMPPESQESLRSRSPQLQQHLHESKLSPEAGWRMLSDELYTTLNHYVDGQRDGSNPLMKFLLTLKELGTIREDVVRVFFGAAMMHHINTYLCGPSWSTYGHYAILERCDGVYTPVPELFSPLTRVGRILTLLQGHYPIEK